MDDSKRSAQSAPINRRSGFLNSLQTIQDEDFYAAKKQKQLSYQNELDRQIDARRPVKADPGLSMPAVQLKTELQEVNREQDRLSRYRKKHEIENHTNLSVNGSHVLGGPLQRDEAEFLRLKKDQQRKEMQEALQKQIEEKKARLADRQEANSPVLRSQPTESLSTHDTTVDRQLESSEVLRKSQSLSVPKDEETIDYLNQLCQKLIKDQEELKNKVQFQGSVIEKLKQSQHMPAPPEQTQLKTPATNRQSQLRIPTPTHVSQTKVPAPNRVPSRRASAQKQKQREELARISEIESKIEAARKRADQRKNVKSRPEPRVSRQEQPAQRRSVASSPRVDTKPLRIQSAMPVLSNEVELPPLLKAQSYEPVHEDEFAGRSHFIYLNSEGNFDELDKFMQIQAQSRSPVVQSKFPRDVFTSKRGLAFTPS